MGARRTYRTPSQRDVRLFEKHMPFVWWCCQHYGLWRAGLCGMTHMDYFQQGCIGLWKAVLTFNRKKGTRFLTYARPKILWALADGIENWRFGRKNRKMYPGFDHSQLVDLPTDDDQALVDTSDPFE